MRGQEKGVNIEMTMGGAGEGNRGEIFIRTTENSVLVIRDVT